MYILSILGAFVFCLLGKKLMSKTQESGRTWLHLFAILFGLLPTIALSVYDKDADGFAMLFVMAIGGTIGAVIAMAIDACLNV